MISGTSIPVTLLPGGTTCPSVATGTPFAAPPMPFPVDFYSQYGMQTPNRTHSTAMYASGTTSSKAKIHNGSISSTSTSGTKNKEISDLEALAQSYMKKAAKERAKIALKLQTKNKKGPPTVCTKTSSVNKKGSRTIASGHFNPGSRPVASRINTTVVPGISSCWIATFWAIF